MKIRPAGSGRIPRASLRDTAAGEGGGAPVRLPLPERPPENPAPPDEESCTDPRVSVDARRQRHGPAGAHVPEELPGERPPSH